MDNIGAVMLKRDDWLADKLYLGNEGLRRQWIEDVPHTYITVHSGGPEGEFCTRKGSLDRVDIASNVRSLHLFPEQLAKHAAPEDWLTIANVFGMDEDADKLAQLDRSFDDVDRGMLAAIRKSDPKDGTAWVLTVAGIKDAWDKLAKFSSRNPEQRMFLVNLYSAFNAIRDRLTSASSEWNGNPLVKTANTLESLMTKMAAAGLTGRNGEKIIEPKWDSATA